MKNILSLGLVLLLVACSQEPKIPMETPLVKRDTLNVAAKAKEIRQNTAAQVADGLKLELWASDSLVADPIAMDINDAGDIFLTRTNRQKNSEFDVRGHRSWMIPEMGFQTVEDRRAFLHETFAPEKSEENSWMEDLNNDSIYDWRDLAVEREEIWKIQDTDKDGYADKSTRIFNDLHEEITDVAGALLVHDEEVYLGAAPDMWHLEDKNGDEVLETRTSLATGFGIHIGFSGHGMSGAVVGPDGKLYYGIGDIGANLTDLAGNTYDYANEGVIVRSNPDGSDFEIFAHGLRNTHEFVFDQYGNIITSDNDGDHPGESERLMYIIDGLDGGWRHNWQYGKYDDPKNNSYKVWMDEKMHVPHWEGQAAYFIPTIKNYQDGPTGMVYNPGTALGSKWKNSFFLVDFVGTPTQSHIWNFTLEPKGASFVFGEEIDVISGILPTGIRFGPDGALYIADWINGWKTNNLGRVWRLDADAANNDLAEVRKETERLIQLDYSEQDVDQLSDLLFYADMRVRQKAQFELVKRGKKGAKALHGAMKQTDNQLARIHGIWGIGQLAAQDLDQADQLLPLLQDSDPEIVAQATKVLGDVSYKPGAENIVPLLFHDSARVQFFAAQALGRMQHKEAVTPILEMLKENNDADIYLRYAGVMALTRIGDVGSMTDLVDNPDTALRLAAVLVLRKLGSPHIALFLKDSEEYIATEAARGINDDRSIPEALPQLAAVLQDTPFTSEALLRRAINASLRVGGTQELDALLSFAQRSDVSVPLRAEALATLGTWANPSLLDRVDGWYRGEITRDPVPVRAKVQEHIPSFLKETDPQIQISVSKMLTHLEIKEYNQQLAGMFDTAKDPAVKKALLVALNSLSYEDMPVLVKKAMQDKDQGVRTTAVGLIGDLDIATDQLPGVLAPIFKSGSNREQQEVLLVLGEMPLEKSEAVLDGLIDNMAAGKLSPALSLDLIEAVDATESAELIAKMEPLKPKGTSVEAFQETLHGGNGWNGRQYFMTSSVGQCARCHSVNGSGGSVGPALDNIGSTLSKEEILQALIEPSARLAPGYGVVSLELNDGQKVTGVLLGEHDDELILQTSEAEPLDVPVSRIAKRTNIPSSMPPMGSLMSRREIRDMVAFLSNLK